MQLKTTIGTINVPDDADVFPVTLVAYQATVRDGIVRDAEDINRVNMSIFDRACKNWLLYAGRSRDNNLPIPPKPIAAKEKIAKYFTNPDDHTLYVWIEDGQPIAVCPDLPPVQPKTVVVAPKGEVMNLPASMNGLPDGFPITGPDGDQWVIESAGTPFGVARFLRRVQPNGSNS